jgi:L-lactate dehydrogenase complex protein LldG
MMMSGRNDRAEIFERIHQANKGRMKTAHPGKMMPPQKASFKGKLKLEQFISAATAQFATITELDKFKDVPKFISEWLKGQNLSKEFVVAPVLGELDWSSQPTLSPRVGSATTADVVGVSLAYGAAAETGTVMMVSGHDTPTTLNFTPDVELILLSKRDISAGMEGCWDQLRMLKDDQPMPRAVNFITGPSRTADVEATMVLGAHGPRRLHIIVLDEASPWQKKR